MMHKLMMEGVWCLRCRRHCEKAHGWRDNGGPTQVGLVLDAKFVHGDSDAEACVVVVVNAMKL